MPVTVIKDTVQDAELEILPAGMNRTRTGLIKGIQTDITPDPLVLEKAYAALIPEGIFLGIGSASTYPGNPALQLNRILIRPYAYNAVRFFAYYSSIISGAPPSVYTVTEDGYQGTIESNQVLGTRQPIEVTATVTLADGTEVTIRDTLTRSAPIPMRALNVTATGFGTPPAIGANYCAVNSVPWCGLPKGYWKIDRVGTIYSKFQGSYTVTATATTKTLEDWSITSILKDAFGKYIKIDPGQLADIIGQPYGGGATSVPGYYSPDGSGMARVYDYPLVNFAAIFGFSSYP